MASVKKNYFYNLTAQLLAIILPIVTTPYVTRVLGNENLGIFNYAQSIVNYFILFGCIGLNTYGQREISFYKGNRHKQSITFFEILLVRFTTISLSIIVYILGIIRNADYPIYYWIFGIEIIAAFFDISWFLQGNEEFKSNAVRAIVTRVFGILFIFVFVRTQDDLWIYILCCSGAILIGYLWLWGYIRKNLERVTLQELHPLRHIKPALVIFLPQIAVNVYTQLDKTMIGILTGGNYAEVGFYSQAEKIVKLAMTIVTSLGSVMLSRVTIAIARNDSGAVVDYINKSFKFMHLLAWPITFGIASIATDFVPWFFGEGYNMVVPCMIALSPLVVIISCSYILGMQYMIPAQLMKQYSVAIMIGMVMNIVFNCLLIPVFGAMGAVVATLIAELTVTIMDYILLRDMFSISIFLQGYKNFISAMIMGAGVYFLSIRLPSTIWATIVEVTIGCIIYFGILILLKDDFVLENIGHALKKYSK